MKKNPNRKTREITPYAIISRDEFQNGRKAGDKSDLCVIQNLCSLKSVPLHRYTNIKIILLDLSQSMKNAEGIIKSALASIPKKGTHSKTLYIAILLQGDRAAIHVGEGGLDIKEFSNIVTEGYTWLWEPTISIFRSIRSELEECREPKPLVDVIILTDGEDNLSPVKIQGSKAIPLVKSVVQEDGWLVASEPDEKVPAGCFGKVFFYIVSIDDKRSSSAISHQCRSSGIPHLTIRSKGEDSECIVSHIVRHPPRKQVSIDEIRLQSKSLGNSESRSIEKRKRSIRVRTARSENTKGKSKGEEDEDEEFVVSEDDDEEFAVSDDEDDSSDYEDEDEDDEDEGEGKEGEDDETVGGPITTPVPVEPEQSSRKRKTPDPSLIELNDLSPAKRHAVCLLLKADEGLSTKVIQMASWFD